MTPYITFVATSRNDNHGGDMHKRMNIFIKALIHQANKFELSCELIMVEWNPPKGQPLLHEILPKPAPNDFLKVKYIVVPPAIHNKMDYADIIPLFQMIAKNVGIRRASAPFVLCTNVDLLFSDRLFAFLAKRELRDDVYYRCNRCDIPNTIDENWPVEQQLKFCEKNIIKRIGKNKFFPNITYTDSFIFNFQRVASIYAKMVARFTDPIDTKLASVDTDGCGDFTLMSKQGWIEMQGYPELELYSIHIDSMGLFGALAAGYEQVILDRYSCTYHIAHEGGWESEMPIERIKNFALKPMLEWKLAYEAGAYIVKNNLKYDLNKPDWGFANEDFEEFVF